MAHKYGETRRGVENWWKICTVEAVGAPTIIRTVVVMEHQATCTSDRLRDHHKCDHRVAWTLPHHQKTRQLRGVYPPTGGPRSDARRLQLLPGSSRRHVHLHFISWRFLCSRGGSFRPAPHLSVQSPRCPSIRNDSALSGRVHARQPARVLYLSR